MNLPETKRTRRTRRRILLTCLAAVLVLVVAGPWLVASTALRHHLLPLVVSDYPGEIVIESADLNWFSPPRFRGVVAQGLEGQPLLTAEELATEQTLFRLAVNSRDRLQLVVKRPRLLVRLDGKRSNLQRVAAAWPAPPDDEAAPDIAAAIRHGAISVITEEGVAASMPRLEGRFAVGGQDPRVVQVDIQGAGRYDWSRLRQLLNLPPDAISIDTQPEMSFDLEGTIPLNPEQASQTASQRPLRGTIRSHVSSATVLDVAVRDVRIEASVDGTSLEVRPEATVAEGSLSGQATVHWTPAAPRVTLDAPIRLENAKPTPGLTSAWLSRVSPILSGMSEIDGELSLALEEFQLDVGDPESLTASGTIEVVSGRLGPSPVTDAVLTALRQVYAVLEQPASGELPPAEDWQVTLQAQTIRYQIEECRIEHSPIRLQVAGANVDLSGSVGIDKTLDLQLVPAIPREWVADAGPLRVLADEQLPFRIEGTAESPRLNREALRQLSKRLGTLLLLEGASDALEDTLLDWTGF